MSSSSTGKKILVDAEEIKHSFWHLAETLYPEMKRHIDKYLEEARKEKSSKSEEPAEVAPVEYEDEAKPVDPGEENSVVPGEGKPDDPDEEEAVNPNEEDPVDPDEVKPDGPGVGETILPDEKKPYDQDEVNPVDPDEKNLVDPDEDEKLIKVLSHISMI